MIPGEFEYHAPTSVDEAVELLQTLGDDAKVLAGGHSLVPAMRFRLALPAALVDINRIADLAYVREEEGELRIGAMTREVDVERSDVVRSRYPLLADASLVIADPLVRNRGTVGGNLAHADPANDHPAVMLAYGATLVAQGPSGRRTIPVDDFFVGLFESALEPHELLVEIRIPSPGPGGGGAYVKLERKVGDYAISAVAVQLALEGGTCRSIRAALTNLGPVPMRATAAEDVLRGKPLTEAALEEAGQAAARECDPSGDLRGSVEYKRDVTRVLFKRAVRRAAERAGGGVS
ncbi:MAG: xanthine dehydrogenase family protein subunit M [Gemmatimonadota bacterium]|jgi:carbon-monoxide dehydrogenase medium subunit